ncbi:MAG: hypothetical protein GY847_28490 [Proteobacteria bacterium]|nr:hypothetical protein [Pseudomonadota bacterium]
MPRSVRPKLVVFVSIWIILLAQNVQAVEILFVANGYYQQEDEIQDHLIASGLTDNTVKKDYHIKSTVLSTSHLLI